MLMRTRLTNILGGECGCERLLCGSDFHVELIRMTRGFP